MAELEFSGGLGEKVGVEYTRYLLGELSSPTDPKALATKVECLEYFGAISKEVATAFISFLNLQGEASRS